MHIMFTANGTYFIAQFYTHHLRSSKLDQYLVLKLIVIILSFINSGDMVEVCSVHVRKSILHMHIFTANKTHSIAFWLSILHISFLKL